MLEAASWGLTLAVAHMLALLKQFCCISQPREVVQNVLQWDKYKGRVGGIRFLITMEGMGLSTKTCHQAKAEERQTSDLGS